jgi:Cysteine synthase
MSLEKSAHLKALGAEVIFTRSDVGKDHPEYYHNMAEDLIKKFQDHSMLINLIILLIFWLMKKQQDLKSSSKWMEI